MLPELGDMSAKEAKAAIAELDVSVGALELLHSEEEHGKARKTVLNALEEKIGEGSFGEGAIGETFSTSFGATGSVAFDEPLLPAAKDGLNTSFDNQDGTVGKSYGPAEPLPGFKTKVLVTVDGQEHEAVVIGHYSGIVAQVCSPEHTEVFVRNGHWKSVAP